MDIIYNILKRLGLWKLFNENIFINNYGNTEGYNTVIELLIVKKNNKALFFTVQCKLYNINIKQHLIIK